MTLPNFISVARLLLVPVLVWALIHGAFVTAFAVFVVAGLSDAVDGLIARQFRLQTTLGTYLDPLADKALLGAIFIGLGVLGRLPDWLVVTVVSRDLLIVAAVLLSYVMGHPVTVRPIPVSKLTTLAQIILAGTALAEPAFRLNLGLWLDLMIGMTALLTVLSAATYLLDWLRHMAAGDDRSQWPADPTGEPLIGEQGPGESIGHDTMSNPR